MLEIYDIAHIEYPEFSDNTYSEIDDFNIIEFDNCVAYELAIRNDDIIDELERFEALFLHYEKSHTSMLKLTNLVTPYSFETLFDDGFDLYAMTYWLFMKRARKLSFFSELENDDLCRKYKKILAKGESHAHYKKLEPLKMLFSPSFESGKILEGLSTSSVNIRHIGLRKVAKSLNGSLIYEDEIDEWNPTGWSSEIKMHDIDDYLLPSIILSFKRPRLKVIDRHEYFSLPINMRMEKNHLKKYIENIKDEYDRRANDDKKNRELFFKSREKYTSRGINYKNRASVALSTIEGLRSLHNRKQRVFGIRDLFNDTHYDVPKPKNIEGFSREKVKQLLYAYDCLSFAEKYNKDLKNAKEDDLKNFKQKEDKNSIVTYCSENKVDISILLDELYRELVKNTAKVPKKHKIHKLRSLANNLIRKKGYKFLI